MDAEKVFIGGRNIFKIFYDARSFLKCAGDVGDSSWDQLLDVVDTIKALGSPNSQRLQKKYGIDHEPESEWHVRCGLLDGGAILPV